MRLQLHRVKIRDVQFSDKTLVTDGVLCINCHELQKILKEDNRLSRVDIELAHPGEECRILQVSDVIQPRVKTDCEELYLPNALKKRGVLGQGNTVVLQGTAVVMSEYRELAEPEKASHGEMIDMSGPAAELTTYGKTHNIVLLPEPANNVSPQDYRTALKIAGLKTAAYLAKAGRDVRPDETTVYELPPLTEITKGYETLPKVVYIFQILTTQFEAIPGYPILYGGSAQGIIPTILHPNEVLDGAIVTPYRSQAMDTYDIQNHSIIEELYRRHRKDLCFVGVIITLAHDSQSENERAATIAANLAKWILGADGAILTKSGGGAPEVPLAQTAEKCEKLGVKTALAMLHYAADVSDPNFHGILIFNVPEVDAIVSMGTPWDSITLPPMKRIIGKPVPLSEAPKVSGEMVTKFRWIRGATTQLGSSRLIATQY